MTTHTTRRFDGIPGLRIPVREPFSFVCAALLTGWIAGLYWPGILSVDSVYMFLEASGKFPLTDDHFLLLPPALRLALLAGGGFGLVALVQVVAGLFGMRALMIALARFFDAQDDQGADLAASLVLLVRKNSFVLYPPLAWLAATVFRHAGTKWTPMLACLLLPVCLALGFAYYQYHVAGVRNYPEQRNVMALDLGSIVIHSPSVCVDISVTSCPLILETLSDQLVAGHGAIDSTYNQGWRRVYDTFLNLAEYPELQEDFLQIVHDHPWLWLTVKFMNYADYLRPVSFRYFFQDRTLGDFLGLAPNHELETLRTAWVAALTWVSRQPLLRWFGFVHIVWLSINALALIVIAELERRAPSFQLTIAKRLLFVPAAYYASYLLALTASDFRFMYPSTLIVQVLTLTFLFSLAVKWLRRMRGRVEQPGDQAAAVVT